MIKSHAEMNSEHYKLLRENPSYRAEFMVDVMREEMMMSQPYTVEAEPKGAEIIYTGLSQDEREEFNQMKSMILGLRKIIMTKRGEVKP